MSVRSGSGHRHERLGRMRRRPGRVHESRITLAHGAGGRAMHDLIDDVLLPGLGTGPSAALEDQARLPLAELARFGDRLAFTTDSFVVDPLFFPGGDIGALAINGTVNDLAVGGAVPLLLSAAVILEEGFPIATLREIVSSMGAAARAAGVTVVTGDTKVVPHGAADKLFINTAGVGVIRPGLELAASAARPGDAVLVNGWLGDHGAAVLNARGDLALEVDVRSDCRALAGLIEALLAACPQVRSLRDATRGGVATVLNEFAAAAGVGIEIDERALPVRDEVRGMCEILGLDPLYLANEGKVVAVVPPESAGAALDALRRHPAGQAAAVIGEVREAPAGTVVLSTVLGGRRIVDMLVGEQLPRIC